MGMLKRIRAALGLCLHKWEMIERYSINGTLSGNQVGELYVLRCVHCGDIKRRTVRL